MDQRPAVVLAAIRRLAQSADRRGTMLDPKLLLDVIEGKKQ